MDAVVVLPNGRQPLRLGEEVAVLLQELGQQGVLGLVVPPWRAAAVVPVRRPQGPPTGRGGPGARRSS
jgi:hypothetical protein